MTSSTFVLDQLCMRTRSGAADRICRFVRKQRPWEDEFTGQPFTLNPFQERSYHQSHLRPVDVRRPPPSAHGLHLDSARERQNQARGGA
jgi:hypothetical protein